MKILVDFFTAISLWVGLVTILVFLLMIPYFHIFVIKRKKKAVFYTLASVLLMGVFLLTVQNAIFIHYLKSNLKSDDQIVLQERTQKSTSEIKNALLKLSTFKGKSGSHPIGGFSFDVIINEQAYRMRIEQDSRDENFYWVYYEGYGSGAEIGFITFE
ncbi:hypothetical protein ACFOSD_04320 [Salinispirillum marinum]|uniref:Uncharacterized protein n=2 Tax=Saccharospirillaceae TaxID=255527 RepID=A0ABV8BE13_9GAMM